MSGLNYFSPFISSPVQADDPHYLAVFWNAFLSVGLLKDTEGVTYYAHFQLSIFILQAPLM